MTGEKQMHTNKKHRKGVSSFQPSFEPPILWTSLDLRVLLRQGEPLILVLSIQSISVLTSIISISCIFSKIFWIVPLFDHLLNRIYIVCNLPNFFCSSLYFLSCIKSHADFAEKSFNVFILPQHIFLLLYASALNLLQK